MNGVVRFLLVWFVILCITRPQTVYAPQVTGGSPVPVWFSQPPQLAERLRQWPRADPHLINEVAVSVARWSHEVGVDPVLVLAVMRVENPWLKPDTVSYAGAVGLMQVMPRYWSDSFHECGDDLTNVDTNICKGAYILAYYLERNTTFRSALLAYNGCGNTHCEWYHDEVTRFLD